MNLVMKYMFSIVCALLMTCTLSAQEAKSVPEDLKSLLKFEQKTIDLGKVKKGEKREATFEYTNISDQPVEIEFISVCECTEYDHTSLPVAPGEKGTIDIVFDSSSKDKSDKITLDILLTNVEPDTGYQIVEQCHYTFELVE